MGSGLLGASRSRKAVRLAKGEATFPGYLGSLRKASACLLLPLSACLAGLVLDLHAQSDAGVHPSHTELQWDIWGYWPLNQ